MKTIWDVSARDELRERIGRLSPTANRLWGKMSAPEMIAHLVESMRMANGEIAVPSKKLPLRFTPIKQFVIFVAPFPKGAPTAPQLIGRSAVDWPSECGTLCRGMDQFAERGRSAALPEHPAFGKLTARAWGRLIYRHMDHHLRQFGV
jgi:Protein of unknown function (DUF1569)